MKVMGLLKADKESEAGVPPTPELMARMGPFLEEITKAGVLLATDGLHPSSKGSRVRVSSGKCTVTDGPFAETRNWWRPMRSSRSSRWMKRSNGQDGSSRCSGAASASFARSSKRQTSPPRFIRPSRPHAERRGASR